MTTPPSFSEEEIERVLRDPFSVSAEVRARVERALRESEEARAVADSIRSFYESMDAVPGASGEDAAELVDRICTDDFVLHLRLVRHNRRLVGHIQSGPQTLMAAATDVPSRPRVASTSFGTDGSNVLVRVLYDRHSREYELYVLADDAARCAFALVSFPGIGLEVATDEGAHASFVAPSEMDPDAWAEQTAVVRLPVSATSVDLGKVGSERTGGGVRGLMVRDHVVELTRTDDKLHLRVTARRRGAPIVSLATVTESAGGIRLVDLSDGEGEVDLGGGSDPHTLRLYA